MEGGSGYRKGLWAEDEDRILMEYVQVHGKGKWSRVAKITGLKRCGKSCRLRWINYLSPTTKHGGFSEEEDDLIIRLHNLLGNRWSLIAGRVPGRTDNQVKNHWNTHLSKKLGIKKAHKSKLKNSSKTLSLKAAENLSSVPSESNFEEPKNGFERRYVSQEDGSQSTRDFFSTPPDMMTKTNEDYDSSLWLRGYEGIVQNYHPGFMDFVNEYPLDFLWHGI